MIKKSLTKNILAVVAVIVFGFILLNLTFGLCALVYQFDMNFVNKVDY